MQVKRYEAVDMNEAVKMVKIDLGPEAVILTSRRKNKGNGVFGMFGRPVIEVTAALPHPKPEEAGKKRYSPDMVRKGLKAPASNSYSRPIDREAIAALDPVIDSISEMRESLTALSSIKKHPDETADRISDDVRELKSMMSYLIDQSSVEKESKLGKSGLAAKRILKERGIAGEYIQALLEEVIEKPGQMSEPDLKTLLNAIASRMKETLNFGGAIEKPEHGETAAKVVAFTGPTGVGKTTTIAKIASNLALSGVKVGLITIDTFRVAAVEQLKIYAQILNIPIEVALSPADIAGALHIFRNKEVVLIDTAGRSQRDLAQIKELKRFLDKHPGIDTMLVLSASSSEKQMEEAIRNFSALCVSGLIFTKLDEAADLGAVFNQHIRTGLPVTYFTTGQSVPEDIETASAKKFIRRLFKKEKYEETTING